MLTPRHSGPIHAASVKLSAESVISPRQTRTLNALNWPEHSELLIDPKCCAADPCAPPWFWEKRVRERNFEISIHQCMR